MAYVLKTEIAIKMAILYVINKFKDGISGDVLTEIAVYSCGINYFTLRQSLFRLEQDEFIVCLHTEFGEMFVINEKGSQALDFFVKKLPYRFREDVTEYIRQLKPEQLPGNEFICDYFPSNDLEYKVVTEYRENGQSIMKLEFTAGDKETAKKIVTEISDNNEKFFGDIYNVIMKLDKKPSD